MTSRFVKQSLLAASAITIGMSFFSRFFGYVREAVIAGYFGTSATLDTFIIAFTVPEIISFVVFAALPVSLIPLAKRAGYNDKSRCGGLFWTGALAFGFLFITISLLLYVFRDIFILWLAPTLDEVQLSQGRQIAAILAWFVFFRGMEAYFRSWLFARKHFLVPATSSVVINIVILVAIYLFYGSLSILSLAIGWLAGSAILFFYNVLLAIRIVRPGWCLDIDSALIVRLLRVTVIVGILESIALIYPVVDRFLAARLLGEGQISALRYAVFLIHIPTGIFVVSFNLASFPWVADLSIDMERQRLAELYRNSVRLLMFGMAFVALGVAVFAEEISLVAFKRGAFDTESLVLTASPLLFYALGIVFYSVLLFQMRFYYAHTMLGRLGAILSLMLIFKILLSYLLVDPMGHSGLALATSITWVIGAVIMTCDLGRVLKISMSNLFVPTGPKILISLVCVLMVWLPLTLLWQHDPQASLIFVLMRLAVMVLTGIAVYVGTAALLRLTEATKLLRLTRLRSADPE